MEAHDPSETLAILVEITEAFLDNLSDEPTDAPVEALTLFAFLQERQDLLDQVTQEPISDPFAVALGEELL